MKFLVKFNKCFKSQEQCKIFTGATEATCVRTTLRYGVIRDDILRHICCRP